MRRPHLAVLLTTILAASGASAQQLTLSAGSSLSLANSTLDLACASLVVAGSFAVGNGTVDQALDVTISLGGNLDGDNGTLNITGNWDNSAGGTFNAGTGSVNFVDGCALGVAAITGSTTFSTLTLTTTTGKTYQLEAGSTQTIGTLLSISGVTGTLSISPARLLEARPPWTYRATPWWIS